MQWCKQHMLAGLKQLLEIVKLGRLKVLYAIIHIKTNVGYSQK